jgi:hypothetical protein
LPSPSEAGAATSDVVTSISRSRRVSLLSARKRSAIGVQIGIALAAENSWWPSSPNGGAATKVSCPPAFENAAVMFDTTLGPKK